MSLESQFKDGPNHPSDLLFPVTIEEAVRALAAGAGAARVVAGGTDLMLELGKMKPPPRCLVSTERIVGLDRIEIAEGFIEVGAAVTFSQLKDHPYLNQQLHVLADAARSVGTRSIQNAATLAGNIVNAMPAADGVVAAVALETEACIVDPQRSEWRPVESLFLGPGVSAVDPTRQLVTCIRIPRRERRHGTAWCRLGRRPSLTLPILNCAVSIFLDENGERIEQAGIALGPVAPRPFRARAAEQYLAGRPAAEEAFAHAAGLARQEADPRGNVLRASRKYRLDVLPAIVEEALSLAARRASRS